MDENQIETVQDEAVVAPKPQKPKRGAAATACEYAETFCYAVALMIVLFLFVFRYVTVVGESMNDTLHNSDNLIISDLFYEPKTGDIVVINRSSRAKPIIKRVIATGGQTVKIDFNTWEVWVDGNQLDESYVTLHPSGVTMHNSQFTSQFTTADNTCEFTVEDGCIFVLGDNRNNSQDSRYYGFFTRHEIVGRVIFRVTPRTGVVG